MTILIGDEIEIEIAPVNLSKITVQEFGALILLIETSLDSAVKDLMDRPDMIAGLRGLRDKGVLTVEGSDIRISFKELAREGGI